MHLGFHYHIPAYIVDGKIYTMAIQGLFIDSLAVYCDKVTLFLLKPAKNELKELDYQLTGKNIELVFLMKRHPMPVRLLLYPFINKRIMNRLDTIDILLMRAPTPLLPQITKNIQKKIPYSYLVVGEMSMHVDSLKQKSWRKSLIKKYINWNEAKQEKYSREALVFCNSALMFEKYKNLSNNCVAIKTTTLKKADLFVRKDTCLSSTIQVLFTGRIEEEKGILEITEAIGQLNIENIDCVLNLVGWANTGDNIVALIKKIAQKYGIEDKIIFHGFKKAGEELFSYYKKADIYIIASQNNEGFPRTIWEALAHSVPSILVPVGSIPFFLKNKHDALFIERKNVNDIKVNIKRLIENPELRQGLIRNGLETVKDVTLEIQSRKMIDEMLHFIENKTKQSI